MNRILFISVNALNIILIFIATISLIKNINHIFAYYFFCAVLCALLWEISTVFFIENPPFMNATFWSRLGFASAWSSLLNTYLFVKNYNQVKQVTSFYRYISVFIINILSLSIFFVLGPYIVIETTKLKNIPNITYGKFYLFYFLIVVSIIFFILREFTQLSKKNSKHSRLKIRYIKTGIITTIIIALLTNLFIPMFFGTSKYSIYGPLSLSFFSLFSGYALINERLYSLKYILGKILYYLLLIAFPLVLFLLVSFIQSSLWSSIFSTEAIILGIPLSFIFIILFWFYESKLKEIIENKFLFSAYNPYLLKEEILNQVFEENNLEILTTKILTIINLQLDIKASGIFFYHSEDKEIEFFKTYPNKYNYKKTAIKTLLEEKSYQLLLDNKDLIDFTKIDHKLKKDVLNLTSELKFDLLVPFKNNAEHIIKGFLVLTIRNDIDTLSPLDIRIIRFLRNRISARLTMIYSNRITHSEITRLLKMYSEPNKLQKSKLSQHPRIQTLSKEYNLPEAQILRALIDEGIEFFKPNDKIKRRTLARIKYEILRMIAYENAKESQIMWDLGFESYVRSKNEKAPLEKKPRYPFSNSAEYSAISKRSFKRIKKEAIVTLKWKIQELLNNQDFIDRLINS